MKVKEDIFHHLSVAVQQLRFRDNQQDITNEILNTNWNEPESANKTLEKYLGWLKDPTESEYRKMIKDYLDQVMSDDTFDFNAVIEDADVVFDDRKNGSPRVIFEAIYAYLCENSP